MSIASQISASLVSSGFPKPSDEWLTTYLVQARVGLPLPSLTATAKHRLLATDFTGPNVLSSSNPNFPRNVSDPVIKELKLPGPIPVQVISVEDLSKSRWEQIEALEAVERGETTRGREVIQVVEGEGSGEVESAGVGRGPHKLVLQDIRGQTVFAMELKNVSQIDVKMNIGTKLMLKNAVVARGMILLEPKTVTVLGGKIEALHTAWSENRKKELQDAIAQIPRG